VRDEYDHYKSLSFKEGEYQAGPLQIPVIEKGVRVAPAHSLLEKKAFFDANLASFSPAERRLINPHYYKVDISDALYDCKMGIIDNLVKEIEEFSENQ
ncbi:MAG: hypothetical protein II648_03540, partial [Bacteroidales bacterium]|nr:hypothetical protein [Bacteroidales bacterium]